MSGTIMTLDIFRCYDARLHTLPEAPMLRTVPVMPIDQLPPVPAIDVVTGEVEFDRE